MQHPAPAPDWVVTTAESVAAQYGARSDVLTSSRISEAFSAIHLSLDTGVSRHTYRG